MKLQGVLSLAAVCGALVIPEAGVLEQVTIETQPLPKTLPSFLREGLTHLQSAASETREALEHALDQSAASVDDGLESLSRKLHEERQTLRSSSVDASGLHQPFEELKHSEPHGLSWWGKPKKPHRSHHKPEKTVYQLISESKYTTKLAALINEYDDIVDLLNGTSANFTVFAPTDAAFAKIPKHAPKPSKEYLKKVLTYHVSGDFYPAGRLLSNPTIPTLLNGTGLSADGKDTPQRLSYQIGLRGLTLNYLTQVVAIDIFGTNGVIHGVNSLIAPPFNAAEIINLVPSYFSTLELGLEKTGLNDAINDTSTHLGGTLFAPTNWAFQKLGYKINGFLFSKWGEKYLKALLKYHVVANQTLYTDAYYANDQSEEAAGIPKGKFHVDLPTLLKDRHLSIDIARFGGLIDFRVNGFTGLAASNVIAHDGVIHVVNSVLIPPKKVGWNLEAWSGGELVVDDLKERLEPFVEADSADSDENSNAWEL